MTDFDESDGSRGRSWATTCWCLAAGKVSRRFVYRRLERTPSGGTEHPDVVHKKSRKPIREAEPSRSWKRIRVIREIAPVNPRWVLLFFGSRFPVFYQNRTAMPLGTLAGATPLRSRAAGSVSDFRNATI